jgi:hypothetical protein
MYGMYKPLRMLVRQNLVDALGRMIWRPSEDVACGSTLLSLAVATNV